MTMDDKSPYHHSVLQIRTPVTVTLARKKEPLRQILDLVAGSMLTFEAHCDEPLTLEAGGHEIARGETVKVGDKFGLRVREILRDPKGDRAEPLSSNAPSSGS